MKRALAMGLSGCAIAALGLVGTAGAASAACVKTDLTTGDQKQGSTVRVSSNSTCNDLNLTSADDHKLGWDNYAGFYYKESTDQWIRGSRGYITVYDFNASSSSDWVVLLSDISNGTKVGVGSRFEGDDDVTVAH